MKYIESVYIDGFRGFSNFSIDNLSDINILVGDNNTGKTSILEAIHILQYPGEMGHYVSVCSSREGKGRINQYNTFINSIGKIDNIIGKTVGITGEINKKVIGCCFHGDIIKIVKSDLGNKETEAFEGTLYYGEDKGSNSEYKDKLYIDEETKNLRKNSRDSFTPIKILRVLPFEHIEKELDGSIIKEGKKDEVIDALKIFDKNILGFDTIKDDYEIKTYIQHKETGMLPVSSYGDGLKKVFYLSSALIKAKGGILLIDEIETSIHYSALKDVFKWLIDACIKYNVQLFATTHSLEAVDALLNCANESKGPKYLQESINIITLKKDEDGVGTKKRVLDGLNAYNFREDFNMELR